jgi:hypothetical protein
MDGTENIIMNTGIQSSDEESEDISVHALMTMTTAYREIKSSTDLGDEWPGGSSAFGF